MATNYTNQNYLDNKSAFVFPRRLGVLLYPRTIINLIGAGVGTDRFVLRFDLIPILTGQSALFSNWSITGPSTITVTSVTINLNNVEILFTGALTEGEYIISVPTGIIADSGVAGSPYTYQGPFLVSVQTPTLNSNPTLVSVVAGANTIAVTISEDAVLLPSSAIPSNWGITGPTQVNVTGVSASGPVITLTTTEQRTGGSYFLSIPGFNGVSGNPYDGPFSVPFTGVGISPTAVRAEVIDSNTIRIIYSEIVQSADALNLANYSVDNGLVLLAVTQETGGSYIIKTSNQDPGIIYSVTVSNVKDLQGNII